MPNHGGLEFLQRHIRERDLSRLLDKMLETGIFVAMRQIDGSYLYSVLKHITCVGELENPEQFFEKLTEQFPQDKDIMTIAQHYEQKGRMEERQFLAKNMLQQNFDPKTIEKLTQISCQDLKKIQRDIED